MDNSASLEMINKLENTLTMGYVTRASFLDFKQDIKGFASIDDFNM